MDTANENVEDPRFCINLEINKGWATCLEFESKGGILPPHKIVVDYDKPPFKCKA